MSYDLKMLVAFIETHGQSTHKVTMHKLMDQQQAIGDLLARINSDGGHRMYQQFGGPTPEAIRDAEQTLMADLQAADQRLYEVRESTVMRMAGNIAGHCLADHDWSDGDDAYLRLAIHVVKIARALVDEVQRAPIRPRSPTGDGSRQASSRPADLLEAK